MMKWDKLEDYILANRAGVDKLDPPQDVWQQIESKLNNRDSGSRIWYWQAAAVLFFVISIGLIINNYRSVGQVENLAIDKEFNNTEHYYFEIIRDKENILTSYLDQYPNLTSEFRNDLIELGDNYQKLKLEFETSRSEEVLNALILNLQLQQNLLNSQLKIIKLIEKENEELSI